jgi:hypothetical protein
MRLGIRRFGMAIFGFMVLVAVLVVGLSWRVYAGPEQEKQTSALAQQLFHFVYESSRAIKPVASPTPTGSTIK